jgi:hypothetical protein
MKPIGFYICIIIYKSALPLVRTIRLISTMFRSQLKSLKGMEKLKFHTENVYENTYKGFLNNVLFDRLNQKFAIKPFFERYASLRKLAVIGSYVIHAFSVATAFVFVFSFLQTLLQNGLLAIIFTFMLLSGIEAFKRFLLPDAFKNYFQFNRIDSLRTIVIAGLIFISISLSFFGAKDAVQIFSPSVQLTSLDSVRLPYQQRINTLEKRLTEVKRSQSWKGKLTPQGQKAYTQLSAQIANVENQMLQQENRGTQQNDLLLTQHSTSTQSHSYWFGLFTLFFDLSLIGLLWFIEYYDYRSFCEFAQVAKVNPNVDKTVATVNQPSEQVNLTDNSAITENSDLNNDYLILAYKKAKANVAAFESKIRSGIGKPETNQKGLEKWQNRLIELEYSLQN